MARISPDSLYASFCAIDTDPVVTKTTVGTTPALGVADASVTTSGQRVIRIFNGSAANTLAWYLVAAGASVGASRTVNDSTPIAAGQEMTIKISAAMRLALVASAASTDAWVTVIDITGV